MALRTRAGARKTQGAVPHESPPANTGSLGLLCLEPQAIIVSSVLPKMFALDCARIDTWEIQDRIVDCNAHRFNWFRVKVNKLLRCRSEPIPCLERDNVVAGTIDRPL